MESTDKYHLFYGDWFYPEGGYNDYRGSFATSDEALDEVAETVAKQTCSWWHIVRDNKVVLRGQRGVH